MNPASAGTAATAAAERLRTHLRSPLTRGGYALVLSSMLTSALGLPYWILAARLYAPDDVGHGAALVAAMVLASSVATAGMKRSVIRFVADAGSGAGRLVRQAYALALGLGSVAGVGFVALSVLDRDQHEILPTPQLVVAFVVGTGVWSLFALQDSVLVAVRRAGVVPLENLAFSVGKLTLLVVLAHRVPEAGVFLSWVLPALVCVVVVNALVLRSAQAPASATRRPPTRRELTRFAGAEHVAALLWQATLNLPPLLVLSILGPEVNASFYVAFQIAYALCLVGSNVGDVLVAEGTVEPQQLRRNLRRSLAQVGGLLVPGVVLVALGAPWILGAVGDHYRSDATTLLRLLAVSAVPAATVSLLVSVAHVRGHLRRVVGVYALICTSTVVGIWLVLGRFGLVGAGVVWLATQTAAAVGLLAVTARVDADLRPPRIARSRIAWSRIGTAPRVWSSGLTSLALVLGAVTLWVAGLRGDRPEAVGDLGTLSLLGPVALSGLGLLAVAFALELRRDMPASWRLAAPVVAFTVLVHGTPAVLYGTVRYAWAWKHLGIVDYIHRHGRVDPRIDTLDVYHNWPGFFAQQSGLLELMGVDDPMTLARWWPLMAELAIIVVLVALFGALGPDGRTRWTAVAFVMVANWVGQDYYSPQSVAYLLHLVVLAVVLRHRRQSRRARTEPHPPRPRVDGVTAVVVLVALALVTSHQITPIMTVVALAALAVTRTVRSAGLAVLMVVLVAGWSLTGARPFLAANVAEVTGSFGRPVANAGDTLVDATGLSPAQHLVSVMGRITVATICLLAVLGVVRQVRRRVVHRRAVALAVAPLVLVAASSFGGEIVFRAYLFALPFLAWLAADAIWARRRRVHRTAGPPWLARRDLAGRAGATALAAVVLGSGFLFGYFGKDGWYTFRSDEVAASAAVLDAAPSGSLLVTGTSNYPLQFRRYEHLTYVTIIDEPEDSRRRLLQDPAAELQRWLSNPEYTGGYVLLTRSQRAEIDALGGLPRGALVDLEQALRRSPAFQVAYSAPDAVVFVLAPA